MKPTLTPEDLHCVANAITQSAAQCVVAQPITDQDLAKSAIRDGRLVERVAWCNRAHESIQFYADNHPYYSDNEDMNRADSIAQALDLQSLALDSIIHWTQPEYYR